MWDHNGRLKSFDGYCTDVFADAAIDFVRAHKEQPFFAYLSTNAPHTPLDVPEKYEQKYRDKGVENENLAKFYGMVDNIDENVGRLLQAVDDAGLRENTIVIFFTDNGHPRHGDEMYHAGQRGNKGTVYEGGIHVPFIMRWPDRLAAGKDIDTIAAHIDLMPTLAAACGASMPDDRTIDGLNLLPLLEGEAEQWPERNLFLQWRRGDEPQPFVGSAVVSQRYKLVQGEELYDLLADPDESEDLSESKPEIVAKMRAAYDAWFEDVSSTRGFAPPRIHVGTPHENPVTLTRQDWRGPQAGWRPNDVGHWEILVTEEKPYEARVDFIPARPGEHIRFKIGRLEKTFPLETRSKSFDVPREVWPEGPARLEAVITGGESERGVNYVHVRH